MRRLSLVIIIMLLCTFLTGCLGESSIDELLTAPAMTTKQQAVLAALENDLGDHITFVYPSTGTSRAAVQFIDLDNDSVQEAVVFFRNAEESPNACIAILEPNDDGTYKVDISMQGAGEGIASCRFLRTGDSRGSLRPLLMEWTSLNIPGSSLAVYTYTDGSLTLGFQEKCTHLAVLENSAESAPAFCYAVTQTDGIILKIVELLGSTYTMQSQYRLPKSVTGIRQLVGGNTPDGQMLFIDEITDTGLQTEIISYADSQLAGAVSAEGYNITAISSRSDDGLYLCRSVGGNMCFPSSTAPNPDAAHSTSWSYWYSVKDGAPAMILAGYLDDRYGFFLPVPSEWLPTVKIAVADEIPGSLFISAPGEDQPLLSVLALSIEDEASGFINSGYSLIGSGGAYRYYARFSCSAEDERFISENFILL